jgi:hypothetical protein
MQLMTAEGLLLSGGAQKVSMRVAAEFCSESVDTVGAWSKRQYTTTVAPQQALLLHSQPPKALGKTFAASSTACTHTWTTASQAASSPFRSDGSIILFVKRAMDSPARLAHSSNLAPIFRARNLGTSQLCPKKVRYHMLGVNKMCFFSGHQ